MTTLSLQTAAYKTEEAEVQIPRLEDVHDERAHQREVAKRRRSFRQLLTFVESEIKTDPLDEETTTPFSSNRTFQEMLRHDGGYKGVLTEAGFNFIREKAIEEVGSAVDLEGFPCEAVLASGQWGSLLMLIVRLYALTLGEATGITELNWHSKLAIKDASRQRAAQMVMQIVAPSETQKGMPKSLVQKVIIEDMNVQLLTGHIKTGIKNLVSNYMNAVKRGTTANLLKQDELLEDHRETGGYAIAESDGYIHHQETEEFPTGSGFLTELICRGLRDLSPNLREVMREYFTYPDKSEISRQAIRFPGQLAKVLNVTHYKANKLADQIVASMRKTMGVTLETRSFLAIRALSEATQYRCNMGIPQSLKYAEFTSMDERPMVTETRCSSPYFEEIYLAELLHKFYLRKVPTHQFMEALN